MAKFSVRSCRRCELRSLTAAIIVLFSAVPGAACSHEWGLADAEKCGDIHFSQPPKVIDIRGGSSFQDTSVDLVVDIPSSDLQEFRELSHLPDFSPGIPEEWIRQLWRQTDFSDDVLNSDPADTRHVKSADGPTNDKRIAILGVNKPESRIYIMLMC